MKIETLLSALCKAQQGIGRHKAWTTCGCHSEFVWEIRDKKLERLSKRILKRLGIQS